MQFKEGKRFSAEVWLMKGYQMWSFIIDQIYPLKYKEEGRGKEHFPARQIALLPSLASNNLGLYLILEQSGGPELGKPKKEKIPAF